MIKLIKQDFKKNSEMFEKIKLELRKYIKSSIPIDHVGSTAIPNLYGKNIIDIVIGVEDNLEFNSVNNILENIGYIPSKKSKDEIYQFFSSIEGETSSGDIHIHVVLKNTERYNEFLILKKYLLINEEEAKNYSDYKRKLLDLGIQDRKEYKKDKSIYVTNLLIRAKKWYNVYGK